MDSELIVRQLSGRYRVKNPGLAPLYKRILDLRSRFQRVVIVHVPRAQNKVADKLANEALDRRTESSPLYLPHGEDRRRGTR